MEKETIRVSYSAINSFEKCIRLYYFRNIYRNSETGNRIQIVNPYFSLGLAVHETIDSVINTSPLKRVNIPLSKKLEVFWKKYEGKKGGFVSSKQELEFKKRGLVMLKRFRENPLLSKKSLKKTDKLSRIKLFDRIDLVGSFDWVEVLEDESLHIIDFKTGRSKEGSQSLQLPIYKLLAKHNYNQEVRKLSYWYLDRDDQPVSRKSEDNKKTLAKIKEKAKKIQKTIQLSNFSCSSKYNRCFWCREYDNILSGKAERVGIDEKIGKDLYYIVNGNAVLKKIYDNSFLNEGEKNIIRKRIDDGNTKSIHKEIEVTKKDIEKNIGKIKKKIKDNLSQKELKVFIEELSKNKK